jgi:hypothetical protein
MVNGDTDSVVIRALRRASLCIVLDFDPVNVYGHSGRANKREQAKRTSPLIGLVPKVMHDVVDLFHLQRVILHDGTGVHALLLPSVIIVETLTCLGPWHTFPGQCSPCQTSRIEFRISLNTINFESAYFDLDKLVHVPLLDVLEVLHILLEFLESSPL